jgi:hypothetical protein
MIPTTINAIGGRIIILLFTYPNSYKPDRFPFSSGILLPKIEAPQIFLEHAFPSLLGGGKCFD